MNTEVLTIEPGAIVAIDLTKMALSRFDQGWRAKAKELATRYDGVVYDATNTKGYNDLKAAIADVRAPRYAAQNVSKASKSELAAVSRAIGAEEAAIIAALKPTEEALVAQLEAEDTRRAAAKAAKEQAERERVAKHQANLEVIRGYVKGASKASSAQLHVAIEKLAAMKFGDSWEEFADQARGAQEATLAALQEVLEETLAREARDVEIEAQRAANEAEKARLADERRRLAADQAAAAAAEKARLAAIEPKQEAPKHEVSIESLPMADQRQAPISSVQQSPPPPLTREERVSTMARMFGSLTDGKCWVFTISGLADLVDFARENTDA